MNNLLIPQNNYLTFKKNTPKPLTTVLKFTRNDFFTNIRGFGKNTNWADEVIITADKATKNIQEKLPFIDILQNITEGAKKANSIPLDLTKRLHTGILRTLYQGWKLTYNNGNGLPYTPYNSNKGKYKLYAQKFEQTKQKPLTNPFPEINLTVPAVIRGENCLLHPNGQSVNSGLKLIENLYNDIQKKYHAKDITQKELNEINEQIATIRWIMAHIMPFERGSDLISNIFMRAMYKSYGIKTYPTIKNLSLDLEAFCTPLNEYKKNFKNYFEQIPSIV